MPSLFTFNRLPEYEYAPLDPARKVFRVVRLLPPRPSLVPWAYGTPRVEILEADIDARPRYDALSYSWDVPAHLDRPDREVVVEAPGGPFRLSVFRPLELALLHLSTSSAAAAVARPLFIDQISIDQRGDAAEKGRQVQLMRDIYARCVRTVVWLGPATAASARWFGCVERLCGEGDGVLGRLTGPRVASVMTVFDAVMDPALEVRDPEDREDRDALLGMLARLGDGYPLDGFADVFDRSWFGRLWVIQEACLAPRVVFACGDAALCFDCLRAGVLFYNIYNTHWVRQHASRATAQGELRRRDALFAKTAGLVRIFQERKAIHQLGQRQGFFDIVLKYNVNDGHAKIGASLAEDRVFGLLGLAAGDDDLRARLRVRYRHDQRDVVRIYTEVAGLLLEHSVDALLCAQFPKRTGGRPGDAARLPSWVPDWAMDLRVPVGYAALRAPVFAAGGPQDGARFRVDEPSGRLTIRGVLVDRVARVGERTHRTDPTSQIMAQVDYRWATLFLDEAADFVRDASALREAASASSSEDEKRSARALAALRLCDSGLSYRHFTAKLGAAAGAERLQALHDSCCKLGRALLRSDEAIAAHRITRIYRASGVVPWYWQPASEMAALRLCARDPVAAGRVALAALADLVRDVAVLCVRSARVSWATHRLWLRRRFGRVVLKPDLASLTRIGLDPQLVTGSDWNDMATNVAKNNGRRLHRTETGFVGVGPARARPGDAVVVLHGGTVPHLLRPAGGDGPWEYLGEAYCDGVMDGEALEPGVGVERDFVLA